MSYFEYYRHTSVKPPMVEAHYPYGMTQYSINYGIVEVVSEDNAGNVWRYKSVTLEPGIWGYDAIVDALVSAEYPAAKMQAVINNYLDSPEDASIKEEYTLMQEWRKEAKRIAREALASVEG